MRNKKPPFEITNTMIHEVAEIAELVGKLTSTKQLSVNPTLRRSNRVRTIHGSLAIEQNTLSLEQVTAVLNGKQVLGPPKDIAEVKNAYEIYDMLDNLKKSNVAVGGDTINYVSNNNANSGQQKQVKSLTGGSGSSSSRNQKLAEKIAYGR